MATGTKVEVHRALAAVPGDLRPGRLGQAGQVQPLRADPPLQLGGGALGDQAAAVEDRDRVCQPIGLLQVLRGEEDGHA
ncbi:MAG: hypothetical protein ACRDPY_35820 [Streptosporangiaceae bacterium]